MNSFEEIRSLQNLPEQLEVLASGRVAATLSKRVRMGRYVLSLLVIAWAVWMNLMKIDVGSMIAVVSFGWLLASRLFMVPWEKSLRRESAALVDEFERTVLGITDDAILVSVRPCALRRLDLLRRVRSNHYINKTLRDWFRVGTESSEGSAAGDCLLYSARFGWRLAREWRAWVTTLWLVLVAGGVIVALARSITLADALVIVAMPLTPLILDVVESAELQRIGVQMRNSAVTAMSVVGGHVGGGDESLRDFQRAAFEWRTETVGVPDAFYRLRRASLEAELRSDIFV